MPKTLPHVLAWLLLAPCTLAQQQDQQPQVARKSGTIYKKQVDGLIGALRTTARRGEAGAAAPGVLGGDVLSTAKVLVAMGHCHAHEHMRVLAAGAAERGGAGALLLVCGEFCPTRGGALPLSPWSLCVCVAHPRTLPSHSRRLRCVRGGKGGGGCGRAR